MFKRFSEQFATTDFDQEMLDYIAEHYAYEDSEWNVEDDCLVYGTGLCCFWTDDRYSKQSFCTLTKQEFKAKIGMPLETKPTIDVYTTQELSYIEELEDEVNRLNDLCSDYMKIVEEKDAEILRLNNALSDFWGDYR